MDNAKLKLRTDKFISDLVLYILTGDIIIKYNYIGKKTCNSPNIQHFLQTASRNAISWMEKNKEHARKMQIFDDDIASSFFENTGFERMQDVSADTTDYIIETYLKPYFMDYLNGTY